VSLDNFRSYKKAIVELDPRLTILHGPNGCGKTNIIEALQLLTSGSSFRNASSKELINWECSHARISLDVVSGGDTNLLRNVEIDYSEESRKIVVNEKKISNKAEFKLALPCVLFTPDNLSLVKMGSSVRRAEIDNLGSALSANYSKLLTEYKKILTQRNKLLKEAWIDNDLLDAWTESLSLIGFALSEKRKSLIEKTKPHITRYYRDLRADNSEELSMEYVINWEETFSVEGYKESLKNNRDGELLRRQSILGPHRDELFFNLDGRDARAFASQGQQRSIALAWKLAQLEIIREISGKNVLLLMDDVMSELDKDRRRELTKLIDRAAQTVITTANIDYFERSLLLGARVVKVPDDVCRRKSKQGLTDEKAKI
jgi:DNA replication and repair protein RecF